VTQRLEAVPYNGGAIVVEAGAHPGIILVGAGEVVAEDGSVFTSGDFVFPELVLGGGKAVYNVRAAEGGAVVLAGDRSVVQELLATSPTLIEILAGM
jgi:CRP-like cAMP-binding protein